MYHAMNCWTPYFLLLCMLAVVHGSNKKPHKNNPSGESGLEAEHGEDTSELSKSKAGASKIEDFIKHIHRQKVHAAHDVGRKNHNNDDDDNVGYNPSNGIGYPSQFPQTPYGQSLYGQSPFGQNPFGQSPYGQTPYGQNPYGQTPFISVNPGTVPTFQLPNPYVLNYPPVNSMAGYGAGRAALIPVAPSNKLYASQIAVQGIPYGIAPIPIPTAVPRYVTSRTAIPYANFAPPNKNVYYPLFPGTPQAVPYGSRAVVNNIPPVQPMFIPPNNNFLLLQPNQGGIQLPNLQNLDPNNAAIVNLINLLSSGALGLSSLPSGDQVTSGAVAKGV